jgi:hypothetical protein
MRGIIKRLTIFIGVLILLFILMLPAILGWHELGDTRVPLILRLIISIIYSIPIVFIIITMWGIAIQYILALPILVITWFTKGEWFRARDDRYPFAFTLLFTIYAGCFRILFPKQRINHYPEPIIDSDTDTGYDYMKAMKELDEFLCKDKYKEL